MSTHNTLLDGVKAAGPVIPLTDFKEIKGQEVAKRALEVADAGGHNALMSGSPGGGKTLLARALPGILPDLQLEEALEVTRIYSVADTIRRPAGDADDSDSPLPRPASHHQPRRIGGRRQDRRRTPAR